ncbi:hypothetical protein GJ496_008560 [Pomphorhynchus laevis]|nr:hypothetical protein GJ496_008560 [Pomphorhynchus laevis]
MSTTCPVCKAVLHGKSCFRMLSDHCKLNHPHATLQYCCSFCRTFHTEKSISVRAHAARCKSKQSSDKVFSTSIDQTFDSSIVQRVEPCTKSVSGQDNIYPFNVDNEYDLHCNDNPEYDQRMTNITNNLQIDVSPSCPNINQLPIDDMPILDDQTCELDSIHTTSDSMIDVPENEC